MSIKTAAFLFTTLASGWAFSAHAGPEGPFARQDELAWARYEFVLDQMNTSINSRDCSSFDNQMNAFTNGRDERLFGDDPAWEIFYFLSARSRLGGELIEAEWYYSALRISTSIELSEMSCDDIGVEGDVAYRMAAAEMCGEMFYADYAAPTDAMRHRVNRYLEMAGRMQNWSEAERCVT